MPRNASSRAYSIALDNLTTAMSAVLAAATLQEIERLNEKLETVDPRLALIRMALISLSNDVAEEADADEGIKPFDAVREHSTLVARNGAVA